ncbi:hypothetical protein [Ammoniphilus sp. YIM 78166]|nr:hypothetical protein [Ammoniphilus sp. YIM 78166]
MKLIQERQLLIATSNLLVGHTDAAHGVVPLAVSQAANVDYREYARFVI